MVIGVRPFLMASKVTFNLPEILIYWWDSLSTTLASQEQPCNLEPGGLPSQTTMEIQHDYVWLIQIFIFTEFGFWNKFWLTALISIIFISMMVNI